MSKKPDTSRRIPPKTQSPHKPEYAIPDKAAKSSPITLHPVGDMPVLAKVEPILSIIGTMISLILLSNLFFPTV
jgi:hypothetical protein